MTFVIYFIWLLIGVEFVTLEAYNELKFILDDLEK